MIKIEKNPLVFPNNSNLSMFIDVLCADGGGESLQFQDQNLQQYLVNVHETAPTTSLPARCKCVSIILLACESLSKTRLMLVDILAEFHSPYMQKPSGTSLLSSQMLIKQRTY